MYMPPFSSENREKRQASDQLANWLRDEKQEKRFHSIYRLSQSNDDNMPMKDEDALFEPRNLSCCLYVSS